MKGLSSKFALINSVHLVHGYLTFMKVHYSKKKGPLKRGPSEITSLIRI